MEIGGIRSSTRSFMGPFSIQGTPRVRSAPAIGPRNNPMRDLAQRLVRMRKSLGNLEDAAEVRRGTVRADQTTSTGGVATSDSLTSEKEGSATTLRSAGAVQGPATDFDGTTVGFSGDSTAKIVLGGSYDGSSGKYTALSIVVKEGGEVGDDEIKLAVYDDLGNKIDEVEFDDDDDDKGSKGDKTVRLDNGIEITLTAGELEKKDSLTLHVSTEGGVVDPNQAFAGTGLPGGASQVTSSFQPGSDGKGPALKGGSSTATATVSGTYQGESDDTLAFVVKEGGTVGEDEIKIDVLDSNGKKVDSVKFDKGEGAGTRKTLDSGLSITLSEGELKEKDSFQMDVVADDQLVFQDGSQIKAGSFTVNGVEIEVEATDTLNSIAKKISDSDAGVTAEFDSETQEFVLTNDEDGAKKISVADDTSGFLDAVGLSDATAELGTDASTQTATTVADLDDVSTGTISVNGVEVKIDAESDSLQDVVDRINAADAGAVASLDGDRIEVKATSDQLDLKLDDGETGFFDAVGIDEGVYEGTQTTVQGTRSADQFARPTELKDSVGDFSDALSELFSNVDELVGELPGADEAVQDAIRELFDIADDSDAAYLRSEFGIRFSFHGDGDVISLNEETFDRFVEEAPEEFVEFLSSENGGGGLIERMTGAIDQLVNDLTAKMDPEEYQGLLVDVQA